MGFELVKEDSYENDISFTPDELVAYLSIQTNVVADIQQGRETLESASNWLLEQVRSFFVNEHATFVLDQGLVFKKSNSHANHRRSWLPAV